MDVARQKLHDAAVRVLQSTPQELTEFKAMWEQGTPRRIFDFLDELRKGKQYQDDNDFNKALDDFFWLLCY